jgi:alkaline phosphatase D
VPLAFDHGVASFDPTTSSVLLWTRTSSPAQLDWVLATDAGLEDVIARGRTEARGDDDCCATVEVTDLSPGSTYFYGFRSGEHRSPVGRTRTLPGDGAERLRIGVTSCADFSVAPLGVYRALAEREVDVVLHLGDYIYEAGTSRSGRRVEFDGPAVRLDDYRGRYAQLRADPDVRFLHARHPMVAIWDDHDLADNAWRTGAKAHDPAEHGDWDDRVGAAARARREWLPIRYREPDDICRTWRSLVAGDLAELILLDTRYEGRDQHPGDEGTLGRDDPDRSLLGDDQRAWVGERLTDTSRPWAVVASGVVVNEVSLPIPGASRLPKGLLPNGYAFMDGRLVHDDQWDGFTAERDLLTERMAARAQDGGRTLVLSGDIHSCWAFEGPPGPDGEPVAVEAVCPAASSAAMGRANLPLVNRLLDHAVRRMPQVQWADLTERGYTICELDRSRLQLEWWIVDPYAVDPGGNARCAAVRSLPIDRWPCRFDVGEDASSDPARPDLPVVPGRPEDLTSLRRRRMLRLSWKVGAAAATIGVAVGSTSFVRRSAR